jgi:hypothetical protein
MLSKVEKTRKQAKREGRESYHTHTHTHAKKREREREREERVTVERKDLNAFVGESCDFTLCAK